MSDELADFLTASETRDAAKAKIDIPRDQWQRPKVVPAGGKPGSKTRGYTRASTLGGTLEDTFGLVDWKLRMTAVGLAQRPELILATNGAAKGDLDHINTKRKLNEITESAMQAAQASAKAHIGTAMHAYAEQVDLGNDPGYIPAEFAGDLTAYVALTKPLFNHLHIEQFCVCDELEVGGTPDRISEILADMQAPDGQIIRAGEVLVTDEKTSKNMDFGGIKFSVQLAVYSRSVAYDWQEALRTPWLPDGREVRQDWGIIIHVPAGKATASLYWVDLSKGWELAKLAVTVREWRKDKSLVTPMSIDPVTAEDVEDQTWAAACDGAATLEALFALHGEAVAAGAWDDVLKRRFTNRRKAIEAAGSTGGSK